MTRCPEKYGKQYKTRKTGVAKTKRRREKKKKKERKENRRGKR